MAIPSSAIRMSYLMPCNAAHAAFILSEKYGARISASMLRLRWNDEVEICTPLRELGERPEKGFLRDDKIKMVERLVGELVG
jgi:hypothetical protein